MNSPRVSIVVPVYNLEKEVFRALDSILAQSCDAWEAIVVNDGSTDDSGATCRRYCDKSDKLRYIEQPNQGVAAARGAGVKAACGEYVIFLDGDDELSCDAVELLLGAIDSRDDVDIVISAYNELRTGGEGVVKKRCRSLSSVEFEQPEYMMKVLRDEVRHEPWARIYRRGLFGEESFPKLRRGQDWLMNIEVAKRVRRVLLIDKPTYNYNLRVASTMGVCGYDVYSQLDIVDLATVLLQRDDDGNDGGPYGRDLSIMAVKQLFISVEKGAEVDVNDARVLGVLTVAKLRGCNFLSRLKCVVLEFKFLQLLLRFVSSCYRFVAGRAR